MDTNTNSTSINLSTATPATPMNFSAPTVSVPSISSSAMLVELSISAWTGRKSDKQTSAEVSSTKGAANGVVNVSKKLLGDCAELDAIHKHIGFVRNNLHYAMTQPWSDTGMRLLSTKMFFARYQHAMSEAQNTFDELVDKFVNAYEWEITQSEARLGDLFVRSEYPSVDELRGKFRFELVQMPLPDAGDFRLDVNNEAQEILRTKYQEHYEKKLKDAMGEIWSRLHEALSKMSERLDYKDRDTKKIFRDSLVDNVMQVVDLLDLCNVTGDSQMSAMKQKLEDTLLGVTPDALREDEHLRIDTKQKVDEILKNMSW